MSSHAKNPTRSVSPVPVSRILGGESDPFVARLKETIGDEPVASFARRCGCGESGLRGYLHDGKRPGLDNLVAIADAGGVTVEWLATGREPKRRADLRALLERDQPAPPSLDQDVLSGVLEAIEQRLQGRTLPPAKKAALIALVYDSVASGVACEPAVLERYIRLAS